MKNNYDTVNANGEDTPIYNGNMGIIKYVDEGYMEIDFFQWGVIALPAKSFDNIELAYAITCHKIQGSQSPYVIVGFDNSAYMMLSREWLYTAVTRAQEYCILCAQGEAIRTAINTSKIPEKMTMLKAFLNKEYSTESIPLPVVKIFESAEDFT
jgi:exodeoxyribonuclease V alpha subunit